MVLACGVASEDELLILLEDHEGGEIPSSVALSEDGSKFLLSFVPTKEGEVNVFAAVKGDELWWEEEEGRKKVDHDTPSNEVLEDETQLDEQQELDRRKQAKIEKHKRFMRHQTASKITVKPAPYARLADWSPVPISVGERVVIPIETNLDMEADHHIFVIEVFREGNSPSQQDHDRTDSGVVKNVDFEFEDGALVFTPKKPVKYTIRSSLFGQAVEGIPPFCLLSN